MTQQLLLKDKGHTTYNPNLLFSNENLRDLASLLEASLDENHDFSKERIKILREVFPKDVLKAAIAYLPDKIKPELFSIVGELNREIMG